MDWSFGLRAKPLINESAGERFVGGEREELRRGVVGERVVRLVRRRRRR